MPNLTPVTKRLVVGGIIALTTLALFKFGADSKDIILMTITGLFAMVNPAGDD